MLPGFYPVTFPQSLGFAHRRALRGVVWHTTQGWRAEHAFSSYARAIKGSCPNITAAFAETAGGADTTRFVTKRRFQHVETWLSSYALERGNDDSGHACRVETNGGGFIQIERVGFADDAVSADELRWFGEDVLAPILLAHPEIPPSVYQGGRMTEDELEAFAGGQLRHRDFPCQPEKHSDPGNLDLDTILHYALELLNPPPTQEADMILLRVVDDPNYPLAQGGVILELSGNGIAWVRSGNVAKWYGPGGVRTVDVTAAEVAEALWTKSGVGPPPSTAVPPSIVHW